MKNAPVFSLNLLQAINDWQRGGDAKQKAKRGKALKQAAAELDLRFRRASLVCFRQLALDKRIVWKLADRLHLTESISAWTLATEVAKDFKGGVPPEGQGLQGIIFEVVPQPEQVIVNLQALYEDSGFREACERERQNISGYSDGIGDRHGSQHEVVLISFAELD